MYCHLCNNTGYRMGWSMPCHCPASIPVRKSIQNEQEAWDKLGMVPAGESRDTGKRPKSDSADSGIE